MDKSLILRLTHKRFGYYKLVGDEISVNCPFCEISGLSRNTTYKLGINIKKEIYHCFRCDAKGRLVNLFPQLAAVSIQAEEAVETVAKREEGLEPLPTYKTLYELEYPFRDLVFKFLYDKRFPPASIFDRVFFVEEYTKGSFNFGPRLLFPIFQFDTYRGFQARTIYKNSDPKYIGASNMDRRSILYNFDKAFLQDEQLVLTEGFFDQIRVGDTAVATLGKIITENQIRLIKLGNFKKIIVFLDCDAEKEAYVNANKLKLYFPTYVAHPMRKDPGDMTYEEINHVFQNKLERVY